MALIDSQVTTLEPALAEIDAQGISATSSNLSENFDIIEQTLRPTPGPRLPRELEDAESESSALFAAGSTFSGRPPPISFMAGEDTSSRGGGADHSAWSMEQQTKPTATMQECSPDDNNNNEDFTTDEQEHEELDEDGILAPIPAEYRQVDLAAAACSVVGQAYEALENRTRSVKWLKRALELDPRCAEAMVFLVERRLLSASDEKELLAQLSDTILLATTSPAESEPTATVTPTSSAQDEDDCDKIRNSDDAWIVALYGVRLSVHDCDSRNVERRFDALDRTHGLGENNDVRCARAEHAYYRHDSRAAHQIAKQAYTSDPYDFACVPVYLASMVELGLSHELFYCAHELVKAYPKHTVSWFAVGCYYLLVGKNDAAQRYFHKSAKLCPRFAPAWIGFGNAFAAQDESEQAMAAYRSASRLFQGSHVPLMFIGMEYLRTNNLPLAKHFLQGAKRLCPSDPMVSNELGVVEIRQGNYDEAEEIFLEVLELFQRLPERAPLRDACESSVFNLGQTYRKKRDFPEAARYFELALTLRPRDAALRAALGAIYHVFGGGYVHRAVDCYHVALGLRPDDTFSSEMLTRALKEVANIEIPNSFHRVYRHVDVAGGDADEDLTDSARDSLQRLST